MKHTTMEDMKWLILVAATLVILVPVIVYDHMKLTRKVKRRAGVQKLSDLYITETGDLVRMEKAGGVK